MIYVVHRHIWIQSQQSLMARASSSANWKQAIGGLSHLYCKNKADMHHLQDFILATVVVGDGLLVCSHAQILSAAGACPPYFAMLVLAGLRLRCSSHSSIPQADGGAGSQEEMCHVWLVNGYYCEFRSWR